MKAAILVAPQQYEVRQIPDPVAPADGLVLRVQACGVCGSDLRRWREGPLPGGETLIGGHEISGVVLQAGAQVRGFHAGDRLALAPDVHCGRCYYCQRGYFNLCDNLHMIGISPGYHGGLAELMLVSAEMLANGIVHGIPDELDYLEGALAEPLSSVLAAHSQAGTSLQDTVVVLGGGPIGCLHVSIARARGAKVILSEPSPARRATAAPFQPDQIVDPSKEDLVRIVRSLTDGVGADIAICANPIAATHQQAIELTRKHGKVILFGGLPKANPLTTLDANRIHYGEMQVIGSFSYHPTFHALALETLRRKTVRAEHIITRTLPLSEINAAFQAAASGEALKVMLINQAL